ncbi:hypothetical protein GCM10029992_21030 [Glycomyces albus]
MLRHIDRSRSSRKARAFGLAALSAIVLGALASVPLTAHGDGTEPSSDSSVGEITEFVLSPESSTVLALPDAPDADTEVTLTLRARWAWRSTNISVCAGATLTDECRSNVVLTTPVQDAATTTFTLPLPAEAGGVVTVYNERASVRISGAVDGYADTAPEPGPPGEPPQVGVPEGTELTVHEGDLVITEPGTVIDAMDIRGLVKVKADDVTIKRSVISGRPIDGSFALITNDLGEHSFTLEDSELRPSDPSRWINGITGSNFTVLRTEIADVVDQIHIVGGDVVVEDSWLHDNLYYDGVHSDNIQIQGGSNMFFRGNWIEDAPNAAVMSTQDRDQVTDVTFEDNRIDGGSCSVNIAMNRNRDRPTTGFNLSGNVFGTGQAIDRCAIIAPPEIEVGNEDNRFVDGEEVRITTGA